MKTYTHKPTGKKYTEAEYIALRNKKAAQKRQQKRARFMFSGLILALVLMVGIFVLPNRAEAHEAFENMQTVEVRMQPDQTVWSIIEELTPNHKTREVLMAMRSINKGKDFDNVKAYSDVTTFYVDSSVNLSEVQGLKLN